MLDWLRARAAEAETVAAVCTGSMLLGFAGLLDGLHATTHWRALDWMRDSFPLVTVEYGKHFVGDGRVFTSAGISAGIDMSLKIVMHYFGEDTARATARHMEYLYPEAMRAESRSEPYRAEPDRRTGGAAGILGALPLAVRHIGHGWPLANMTHPSSRRAPVRMQAARIACTSACAVGSFVAATSLTPGREHLAILVQHRAERPAPTRSTLSTASATACIRNRSTPVTGSFEVPTTRPTGDRR